MITLGLFAFAAPVSGREVVRLTAGEWPPYISDSLENKGLISQIVVEAFALKGVDVKLELFPWVRATELSKSGEWDGTIAFARLKEREPFYLFSDPIYVGRYVLFKLKSSSFAWTGDYRELKNVDLASTAGFGGMGEKFLAAEKNGVIHVQRLGSDIQSFAMLKINRVQAVPSDLEVGYVRLKSLYGNESQLFTHDPHLIHSSPYHLVISKKTKNPGKLIKAFNEGLRKLHESGRYDEIVKSWYDSPIYKEAIPSRFLNFNSN